jgi:RHS repeat-associated protein
VVLVLDGLDSNAVKQKYTWGLDLSGTVHGAGGVGGLLAAEEPQSQGDPKRYWFFYDGNGNVVQVLDATDTEDITVVAKYEYDPYGHQLASTGDYAAANPFRFSTKWLDTDLAGPNVKGAVGPDGMYYYGRRYYSPRLGRWISRDPIEEQGGLNLYGFVKNSPMNWIDALGQVKVQILGEMFMTMGHCSSDKKPGSGVTVRWRPGADKNKVEACCQEVKFTQIAWLLHERDYNTNEYRDWHIDSSIFYSEAESWIPGKAIPVAELSDTPGGNRWTRRLKQEFETVAVCSKGAAKGTAYGAVRWGHEIWWVEKVKDWDVRRWASNWTSAGDTGRVPWNYTWQNINIWIEYGPGHSPSPTWLKLVQEAGL